MGPFSNKLAIANTEFRELTAPKKKKHGLKTSRNTMSLLKHANVLTLPPLSETRPSDENATEGVGRLTNLAFL
jgi:hypothetical protein